MVAARSLRFLTYTPKGARPWQEQDGCGCTCAPPDESDLEVLPGNSADWLFGQYCSEGGGIYRWRVRFSTTPSMCPNPWDAWDCAEDEGWLELTTPPYQLP